MSFSEFYRSLSVLESRSTDDNPGGVSANEQRLRRQNDPAYCELGIKSKRQDLSQKQPGELYRLTREAPESRKPSSNLSLLSSAELSEALSKPEYQ